MSELKISKFANVVAAFQRGEMVIIADDAERENEGDLVVATDKLEPAHLSFMMQRARGLICISISGARARKLSLPLQVRNNNSPFGTPFTVSIDHRSVVGRGVTAQSRVATMKALIADASSPADFVSPGHVFPLIAHSAGVVGRDGQTEGSYDLARIAGFEPSGVICEIMNLDGSMARGADLNAFAKEHGLLVTTVKEIFDYRVREEILVRQTAVSDLSTEFGTWQVRVFSDDVEQKEHLALVYGDLKGASSKPISVRLHSECLTGDVFGSRRCDCGEQLSQAMQLIVEQGRGIVLYLRQEGRGIGLANKIRAYALQDQGFDTVDANAQLGFASDERNFAVAAKILQALEVSKIRLLTNNPDKMRELTAAGIQIAERLPLVVEPDEYSRGYMETKRTRMGHLL